MNDLVQQQFVFRFESYGEQTLLYNEELTKMLAMSVVPDNIQALGSLEVPPE